MNTGTDFFLAQAVNSYRDINIDIIYYILALLSNIIPATQGTDTFSGPDLIKKKNFFFIVFMFSTDFPCNNKFLQIIKV